eukprot:768177-Hanusia_phi.AAC.6
MKLDDGNWPVDLEECARLTFSSYCSMDRLNGCKLHGLGESPGGIPVSATEAPKVIQTERENQIVVWKLQPKKEDVIAISFRGTELYSLYNVIDDCLNVNTVALNQDGDNTFGNFKGSQNPSVTKGFRDCYLELKSNINFKSELSRISKIGTTIVLCGHSLGGALATYCSLDLICNYAVPREKIFLITFGKPHMGDPVFATYCNNLITTNYRFAFRGDIIPEILGFYHSCCGISLEHEGELIYLGNAPSVFLSLVLSRFELIQSLGGENKAAWLMHVLASCQSMHSCKNYWDILGVNHELEKTKLFLGPMFDLTNMFRTESATVALTAGRLPIMPAAALIVGVGVAAYATLSIYKGMTRIQQKIVGLQNELKTLQRKVDRILNEFHQKKINSLRNLCNTMMCDVKHKNQAKSEVLSKLRESQIQVRDDGLSTACNDYEKLLTGSGHSSMEQAKTLVQTRSIILQCADVLLSSFQVELAYFAWLNQSESNDLDMEDRPLPRPLQILADFALALGRAFWLLGSHIPDDLIEASDAFAANYQLGTDSNIQDLIWASMTTCLSESKGINFDCDITKDTDLLFRTLALSPGNLELRNALAKALVGSHGGVHVLRHIQSLLAVAKQPQNPKKQNEAFNALLDIISWDSALVLKHFSRNQVMLSITAGILGTKSIEQMLRGCRVLLFVSDPSMNDSLPLDDQIYLISQNLFQILKNHPDDDVARMTRSVIWQLGPSSALQNLPDTFGYAELEMDLRCIKLICKFFDSYSCVKSLQSVAPEIEADSCELLISHTISEQSSENLTPTCAFVVDNSGTCYVNFLISADYLSAYFGLIQEKSQFLTLTGHLKSITSCTKELKSKQMDLFIERSPVDDKGEVEISSLIFEGLKEIFDLFVYELQSIALSRAIRRFVFTGHSMAGAYALAARMMLLSYKDTFPCLQDYHVVAFGSPQCACFTQSNNPIIKQTGMDARCYVNQEDLVPRLLGSKQSTWSKYWKQKQENSTSSWTVNAIAGGVAVGAGVVAACVATGGIATVIALASAGVLVESGSSVRTFTSLLLGQTAIHCKYMHTLLEKPESKQFKCVGTYKFYARTGTCSEHSGDSAQTCFKLEIPNGDYYEAVFCNEMWQYRDRLEADFTAKDSVISPLSESLQSRKSIERTVTAMTAAQNFGEGNIALREKHCIESESAESDISSSFTVQSVPHFTINLEQEVLLSPSIKTFSILINQDGRSVDSTALQVSLAVGRRYLDVQMASLQPTQKGRKVVHSSSQYTWRDAVKHDHACALQGSVQLHTRVHDSFDEGITALPGRSTTRSNEGFLNVVNAELEMLESRSEVE